MKSIPDRYKQTDIPLMKRVVSNVLDLCVNDIRCMTSTLNIISYYNEVSNGMFVKEMMAVSDMISYKTRGDVGVTDYLNPSLTFAYPFFLLSSTLRFSFAALCTTNFS